MQVTPRCSVPPRGGLSAGSGRVRAALRNRGCLQTVPRRAPLAAGVSLFAMPWAEGLARARWPGLGVLPLWPSELGHRGHHFPGHSNAIADVVPSDVVGHRPENRDERLDPATGPGVAQLQNGVDVA